MIDDKASVSLTSLEAAVATLLASDNIETRLFELEGRKYVFKRAREKSWSRGRACLAALGCRLAFGEWVSPTLLRTGGVQQEAARLRDLARAGRRVPTVLLQTEACIVMSYVGTTFDEIVENLSADERIALFERVADDLADWHVHGCWHGGAQLRNVSQHLDGQLYRIDFEERHGYALSTAATQAYDAFLYFGDAFSHLDAAEVLSRGGELLRRYLAQAGNAPLLRMLHRLQKLLRPLLWVDARFPKLTQKRDTRRIVRFARVVQKELPQFGKQTGA